MQKCTFLCVDMDKCVENRPRSFNLWPQKKPSLSVPLGREILVPLELVVSRHYNPIINYKVGRSTMRTIVVVVLGSRDDGRHIYVYFPKNVQEWGHWKKPNWLRCIYGAGSRDWMLLHGVLFIYIYDFDGTLIWEQGGRKLLTFSWWVASNKQEKFDLRKFSKKVSS